MAHCWTDVHCHYFVIRENIHTGWDYPAGEYPCASKYTANTVLRGPDDVESLYVEIDRYLKLVKADIVISPSDTLDMHMVVAAACKKHCIKFLAVQPAFLPVSGGMYGGSLRYFGAESCDVLCVWSEFWAALCRKNGSKAAIRPVGCPDFDRLAALVQSRPGQGPVWRGQANVPDNAPLVALFLPPDQVLGQQFVGRVHRTIRNTPQTLFIVKPHPRHKLWDLSGLLAHSNVKLAHPLDAVEDFLLAADATVAVMSYTSLKAIMIGRPTIVYRDPSVDSPFFDSGPSIMLQWTDDLSSALALPLIRVSPKQQKNAMNSTCLILLDLLKLDIGGVYEKSWTSSRVKRASTGHNLYFFINWPGCVVKAQHGAI